MNLCDCGDVLTIAELVQILRISPSQYYKLKAHGAFPIAPLPFGGVIRYSKSSVQKYLDNPPTKLRKVS